MTPIFILNLRDFLGLAKDDAEARLDLLWYFAPLGLKWLDSTTVSDNEEALASAKVLFDLYRSYAQWDQLVAPFGSLSSIVQLDKRLKGLVC